MTTGVELSARVVASENVLMRDLDGEAVILNLDNGQYFGLDQVGTRMWACLTSARDVGSAIETLLSEYDTDRNTLEKDVWLMIQSLERRGLVQVLPEQSG